MEFLRFILSSFWSWVGFIVLVHAIGDVLVGVVNACKRNRKIEAYRIGERYHATIENASARDVRRELDGSLEEETEGEKCTDRQ